MVTHVLTLSCPDRPGLVHAVSGWVVSAGGNILDSQQFSDMAEQMFYLRLHVDFGDHDVANLDAEFAPVGAEYAMDFRFVIAETPLRTLVLVSKEGHCLNDLLYRQSIGALNITIPAVVSNHRDLERLARSYDADFHHVPVTPDTKAAAEARLLGLVDEHDIDLVVLARYMQVLTDETCGTLDGRVINIHHSFLPSFKGAKPYHQAHDRGDGALRHRRARRRSDHRPGGDAGGPPHDAGRPRRGRSRRRVADAVASRGTARHRAGHSQRPSHHRLRLGRLFTHPGDAS
jgi:formyltetrahydrofolate deformylase